MSTQDETAAIERAAIGRLQNVVKNPEILIEDMSRIATRLAIRDMKHVLASLTRKDEEIARLRQEEIKAATGSIAEAFKDLRDAGCFEDEKAAERVINEKTIPETIKILTWEPTNA